VALGSDFRRLWSAYAISEFGTGVGFGALPLVAVLVLDVPSLQVSLLAALAGLASAVLALPAGPWIEFHRKRPVMMAADLARFAAVISVPVAMLAGVLTYAQLCVVAVVQAIGTILFAAASGAHLKALVAPADRDAANGRFEATLWTSLSIGPAAGGALTSALGIAWTLSADAVSFLLSAVGVRSLRTPEPAPPARTTGGSRLTEITAGWRYIMTHRGLRTMFLNQQLFAGAMMAASPLLTVLMLRDLGLTPWQYGVGWGAACVGGVAGALAADRLTARFGRHRVLLVSGVGRAVWLWALAFLPAGVAGLALMIAVEVLALFGSGVFNPAFATYRMTETADGYLSRVIACWSITSRTVQPVLITLGGLLATLTSVRAALLVCGFGVLASSALLPWRGSRHTATATPTSLSS
jgi:MFS family permease